MSLTPGSVKRSVDPAGDDILTFTTPGESHVQGVALVNDAGGQVLTYEVCDLVTDGSVTYIGKMSSGGAWLVVKLDESSGLSVRYAARPNNPTVLTYASAWAVYSALTYGTWAECNAV